MALRLHCRNGWFHVSGSVAGQRIRQSCGTRDRREAEQVRAQAEAKAFQRRVYGADAVVTFEEAALAYMEQGGERRFLLPLLGHFKGRQLRSIQPGDIRDAAVALYPHAAPATRNRQGIAPAQAVINFGHQRGWCPPIKVARFKAEKPKRQAVGRDYIDRLRAECNPYLSALMLALYQTGMRVGEAIAMRPRDLDLQGHKAHLPKTKNGEAYDVDLTTELVVALANLPPRNGRVFGYQSRDSVRKSLVRACRRAGVQYLGTHQAGRHSFASFLSSLGWHAEDIADAGRWKSVRMVSETYVHPERAGKRAAEAFSGTKLPQGGIKGSGK